MITVLAIAAFAGSGILAVGVIATSIVPQASRIRDILAGRAAPATRVEH